MSIVNLTPHFIRIVTDEGEIKIPPANKAIPCRVDMKELDTGRRVIYDGKHIPVVEQEAGDIYGLPEPEPDVSYIVSLVVAQAVRRPDVYYPAGLIRNEVGQVTGCRALGQFKEDAI